MSIVGQMASTVVREGIRAANAPPRAAPPRHPGTVATRDPAAITGNGPRKPAPRPIDGALLWLYVRKYLSHYVAFRTEEELDRVTAWVFHASARKRGELGMGPPIWTARPILLVKSRKRGAGKSTLLRGVNALTGSRKTPRITAARFAQLTGQAYEAVCIDEGRLVFGAGAAHQDLQACILDGYTDGSYYQVSKTTLSLSGFVVIASKESLITEATKAVDGDESSIGDIIDRCLSVTLTAPEFPMPEMGKRAEAEGALLCRALVAWTDTYRDALEQAAEDIADEDLEAARERARRGEKQTETPRALQIGRPLRAIGRTIDQQVIAEARRKNAENPDPNYQDPEPQCEAAILACLGSQAEDIMGELETLSDGWGDSQFTGEDDDSGPHGEPEEWPGTASAAPGQAYHWAPEPPQNGLSEFAAPAPPEPASEPATATYRARYAETWPGQQPQVYDLGGPWPTLVQAQAACQATAPEPLHWEKSAKYASTWGATIYPEGPGGPEISYAVSCAAGK